MYKVLCKHRPAKAEKHSRERTTRQRDGRDERRQPQGTAIRVKCAQHECGDKGHARSLDGGRDWQRRGTDSERASEGKRDGEGESGIAREREGEEGRKKQGEASDKARRRSHKA